jgi:predicted Zn-dependent protease
MREHFYALADAVGARLTGEEGFLASFSGETSAFVRFNRSAIRQSGTVEQRYLSLTLFRGRRHSSVTQALTGIFDQDLLRCEAALGVLRETLASASDDPHFLIATDVHSTDRIEPDRLPASADVVSEILRAGGGEDLVGFYAAGPVHAGFANSFGQRNWSTVTGFNFDSCFYLRGDQGAKDRAVKMNYAGTSWDSAAFTAKTAAARARLAVLARPAKTIPPGGYRVFLSPAAMEEVMSMLAWGGFSLAATRTATSPLIRLAQSKDALSPAVELVEDVARGLSPDFQSEGFVKPAKVTLVAQGRAADTLASPRSAAEFGAGQNGADDDESPHSLVMAPGGVREQDILSQLGTGVYIGNLWYLNYSDRNACRMTGMTRFATFWVENGEIVAPLNVMRFDDSVYRMLGRNLVGLTADREWRPSTDTYGSRSTRSMLLPGAIIDDLRLTL